MARPTLLTPELMRLVWGAVLEGADPAKAAQAYGIAQSTYYLWVDRGMRPGVGDLLYREFLEGIERAEAMCENDVDRSLAKGPWQARLAWAERLDRRRERRRGSAGRAESGVIRIERKVPLNVGDDGNRDMADAGGTGDPVDIGGGVVERGLGEPEPIRVGDNVVVIRRKTVA